MIGLVLVSHSTALGEAAADLARQMAGDAVHIAVAGGVPAEPGVLGTDATLVAAALEEAWSEDGVLVLMDLGSAVLSAEFAVDLLPEERRGKVLLTAAPLVEGAVAASVAAAAGAGLQQAAAEARAGLAGKAVQLGEAAEPGPDFAPDRKGDETRSLRLAVPNALGLHARPAALLVRTAAGFDAAVRLSDVTSGRGPVDARSLSAIGALGARQGHELLVEASGPEADAALGALRRLADEGFGEEEARSTVQTAAPSVPGLKRGEPSQGAAPGPAEPHAPVPPTPGTTLTGIPVAPGIVVGPALRSDPARVALVEAPPKAPDMERADLERALAATAGEIRATREAMTGRIGAYEAAIFDAHLLLLEDPALLEPARRGIEQGMAATHAWSDSVADAAARWDALDDPYLRGRAADLRSVGDQVLAQLAVPGAALLTSGGAATAEPAPAQSAGAEAIIVAAELTPAQTAALDPSLIRGIACAQGGPTSHSAILARALGIPCVVALGDGLLAVPDGMRLLLDGEAGTVTVDPPTAAVEAAESRRADRARAAGEARTRAHEPAVTRDGATIQVAANMGAVKDVQDVLAAGADAVGLLRTEFVFLDADHAPTEAEQEAIYRTIAEGLAGRPLTVRTLDAGADKPLAFAPREPETNPFLGVRGVRLGLRHPELLRTQLRAIMRVAADHPLRIMFPMVASLEELLAARELLDSSRVELEAERVKAASLETGIMIEVPAAALMVERLAPHVDFFSVGTNDLAQYTMAAERGNATVAGLADALQPAVLQLIARTVTGAAEADRWAGVCGEVAGDPLAVPLLLGLGVTEFSVAPPRVAEVKQAVRMTDACAAKKLAEEALAAESAAQVRRLCAAFR